MKIILTEPNRDGFVVVASVTSLKYPETQGASCILRKGDRRSFGMTAWLDACLPEGRLRCPIVDVDRLAAMRWLDIANGLNSGELVRKEEPAPDVFKRVLNAAKPAHKMPPRVRSMLFSSL